MLWVGAARAPFAGPRDEESKKATDGIPMSSRPASICRWKPTAPRLLLSRRHYPSPPAYTAAPAAQEPDDPAAGAVENCCWRGNQRADVFDAEPCAADLAACGDDPAGGRRNTTGSAIVFGCNELAGNFRGTAHYAIEDTIPAKPCAQKRQPGGGVVAA